MLESRSAKSENRFLPPSATDTNKVSNKKLQRQQQAEQRKQLQPLKQKISRHETLIEQLSEQHQHIQEQLAQADIYLAENKQALQALLQEETLIKTQLEENEESWMELSEQLEQLKQAHTIN